MQTEPHPGPLPTTVEQAQAVIRLVDSFARHFPDQASGRQIEAEAGVTRGFVGRLRRIASGELDEGFKYESIVALRNWLVGQLHGVEPATEESAHGR
jgi:hypothetical protein